MIIVFSRSKEANGINSIKKYLKSCQDDFLVIEDTITFFLTLRKKNKITAIFCLASSEVLIAAALLNITSRKIPIVMGIYHPKQWDVMLDSDYSKTRADRFSFILRKIPAKNLIFNTHAAKKTCFNAINFSIRGEPNFVLAPAEPPQSSKKYSPQKSNITSISTVGRFVDFKVSSIFSMIDTINKLNEYGYEFFYHIYGEGPLREKILEKISNTQHKEKIFLHDYLAYSEFGETISKYDLYFGMGFTVVHSAMLGIPSIIAIQGESEGKCYGYFHDYNHEILPMFGDVTDGINMHNIYNLLIEYSEKDIAEIEKISNHSILSAKPYQPTKIKNKIISICENAEYIEASEVTIIDIIKIRAETFLSRFLNKKQIHV